MRDCGTSLQPKMEKKLVEDSRTRFAIFSILLFRREIIYHYIDGKLYTLYIIYYFDNYI